MKKITIAIICLILTLNAVAQKDSAKVQLDSSKVIGQTVYIKMTVDQYQQMMSVISQIPVGAVLSIGNVFDLLREKTDEEKKHGYDNILFKNIYAEKAKNTHK